MVRGKFKGAVTYVDANGRKRSVNLTSRDRQSPRKKATGAPTPAATVTPTAEQTPTPPGQQTAAPTSELTPGPAAPSLEPAPEQSPWPGAQETPTAVPQQTATLAREQTATRTSEQQARQPDAQSTIVPTPTPPDVSLRALAGPPSTLPKPPPALDAQTVAALDTVYQEAVKANDVAVMDRILADDFVLVTDQRCFFDESRFDQGSARKTDDLRAPGGRGRHAEGANMARYGCCYCAFEGQRHERPKTLRLQSLVQ